MKTDLRFRYVLIWAIMGVLIVSCYSQATDTTCYSCGCLNSRPDSAKTLMKNWELSSGYTKFYFTASPVLTLALKPPTESKSWGLGGGYQLGVGAERFYFISKTLPGGSILYSRKTYQIDGSVVHLSSLNIEPYLKWCFVRREQCTRLIGSLRIGAEIPLWQRPASGTPSPLEQFPINIYVGGSLGVMWVMYPDFSKRRFIVASTSLLYRSYTPGNLMLSSAFKPLEDKASGFLGLDLSIYRPLREEERYNFRRSLSKK